MNSPSAESDEVINLLNQILRWTKFQSRERVRSVLEFEIMPDPKRILVYEMTNGENGRPEVARASQVPSSTIQKWWDRWFKVGILEPSPKRKGMVRKICSIEEVGLDLPKGVRERLFGRTEGSSESPEGPEAPAPPSES